MAPQKSESFLPGLRCLRCQQFYMPEAFDYVCNCRPNRGSDLGHLNAVYDYNGISTMRIGPRDILCRPDLAQDSLPDSG